MDRKLAYVAKITDITPIPNADLIETVWVKGWSVVCKKGIHSIGEKIIYFEVDSYLPIIPPYEFLRASCYKNIPGLGEGFRIRTIKLKKQLSQGLVIPLPDILQHLEEGVDLTEFLGIQKYEIPIPTHLAGLCKGNFPSFLIKTDQERIQNLFSEEFYQKYKDIKFEVTEKLDGSSMTVYVKKDSSGEMVGGVCSRNLELKLEQEGNVFINTERTYNLISRLKNLDLDGVIALQGELCGPGIQGNKYKLNEPVFFVFDIFRNGVYLNQHERLNLLERLNQTGNYIVHVPIITNSEKLSSRLSDLLSVAEGKSILNNQQEREGIVYKSLTYDGERGSILSFKTISNSFLLKEKD